MPSTWRSYQSVSERRPQSCRERSARPATWSSSTRRTGSACSSRRRPSRQLRALVGREDLLPAVMALERRQMSCPREALRLVVEADPARRGGEPLDERPRTRSEPTDALSEEIRDVRVVATEQLVS